jgi:hypothetical protein
VVPARSSRRGHLLARGNHAAVARKIHLSRLFSSPEPPLSCLAPAHEAVIRALMRSPGGGSVALHRSAADDIDNAAGEPLVIDPSHASWLVERNKL